MRSARSGAWNIRSSSTASTRGTSCRRAASVKYECSASQCARPEPAPVLRPIPAAAPSTASSTNPRGDDRPDARSPTALPTACCAAADRAVRRICGKLRCHCFFARRIQQETPIRLIAGIGKHVARDTAAPRLRHRTRRPRSSPPGTRGCLLLRNAIPRCSRWATDKSILKYIVLRENQSRQLPPSQDHASSTSGMPRCSIHAVAHAFKSPCPALRPAPAPARTRQSDPSTSALPYACCFR